MSDSNSTAVKFCKVCNCATSRYASGRCKPCTNKYNKSWKTAHNKRKVDPNDKRTSKEKRRDRDAIRYQLRKEEFRETSRKWFEANSIRAKELAIRWRKENPDAYRVQRQNRRARKSNLKLSIGLSLILFALQRGKCACCGLPLGNNYHMDHIMPLALGGTNTDDNIQLLRQRCNNQKHAKHPVDFMQSRGFLL